MDRFWRLSSLGVQGGIAAIFCGIALSGYIFVAFELQRFAAIKVEGRSRVEGLSLGLLSGFLLLYLDQTLFATFPHYLGLAGFKSKKTWWIYPIVYQIASTVAWYTGYLPVFDVRACSHLCLLHLDAINEQSRVRSLDSTPSMNPSLDSGTKGSALKDFSYKRLAEVNSIRIARIMPSPLLESPIRCEILEATLDDSPNYIALSYAWDSHEGKVSVICNGSCLTVTPNCARALRQIREIYGKWHAVNVWVDAICIDQGSDTDALGERSQQIQIMGEVYKRATHVIAWLGDHKAHSQEICDFFLEVGRACGSEADESRAWIAAKNVAHEKTRQWIAFTYEFRDFFHRSWFQRLWPVQEVTLPLPGKVTLLCGGSSIPFDHVRVGWQVLTDIGFLAGSLDLDQAVALQFYISDALALKRKEKMKTGIRRFGRPLITDLSTFSLTSVMRTTRFKSCSVAKDKFFALYGVFKELGIIKGSGDIDVTQYAHLSDKQAFFLVFMLCFAKDRDLSILKSARSHERYLTHDDFWATQFDPYDTLGNMIVGIGPKIRPLFSGSITDNTPAWRKGLPSFIPDWTQWTPGDLDDSDIALVRSYSTRQLWYMPPLTKYGVEKRQRTALLDPQHAPRLLRSRRLQTTIPNQLQVQVKVIGTVRSTGIVDSFGVLWDLLASTINFYAYRRQWTALNSGQSVSSDPIFKPVPEAVVAALIESVRNFILNSTIAQILLSLRSIYRESSTSKMVNYVRSGILVWCLWPLIMHGVCALSPSALTCKNPESLAASYRTDFSITLLTLFVYDCNASSLLPRRSYAYWLFRRNSAAVLISGTCLLWTFRVPIYSTMYGKAVLASNDWFEIVIQVGLIAQGVCFVASLLEDKILSFLSRIVQLVSLVFLTIRLLVRTRLRYMAIAIAVGTASHACTCIPGTLREIIGSNAFKRAGTFTSGLTFFTTDTWLTGSTGGPVQLFDVVAIVDGVDDPMILRCSGNSFTVVAAAYVGNKSRQEVAENKNIWETIILE